MKLWTRGGKVIRDASGRLVLCDDCPCPVETGTGTGTEGFFFLDCCPGVPLPTVIYLIPSRSGGAVCDCLEGRVFPLYAGGSGWGTRVFPTEGWYDYICPPHLWIEETPEFGSGTGSGPGEGIVTYFTAGITCVAGPAFHLTMTFYGIQTSGLASTLSACSHIPSPLVSSGFVCDPLSIVFGAVAVFSCTDPRFSGWPCGTASYAFTAVE